MYNIRCIMRSFSLSPQTSYPFLRTVQTPSPMETHLWYINPDEVKDRVLLSRYMDMLSPCEKENVLSIKGHQQQKIALLTRSLARTTLARYNAGQNIDPRSLKFKKNIYGKPELESEDEDFQLHFNISHTSSLIACGISSNSLIGIDVEEKERKIKSDVLCLARRYFSDEEFNHMRRISNPESQRREFIKLWTLKEGFVKAMGTGFSAMPFKTFTIRLKAVASDVYDEIEIVGDPPEHLKGSKRKWDLVLMEVEGTHYASICRERDEHSGQHMKLSVWKTIPLIHDEVISSSHRIRLIGSTSSNF